MLLVNSKQGKNIHRSQLKLYLLPKLDWDFTLLPSLGFYILLPLQKKPYNLRKFRHFFHT